MHLASPWKPRLSDAKGLPFERLVSALAEDIAKGDVPDGARLPPHRELAYQLGIGLGTVTKAYGVLERRGLVYSVRGRGMFVSGLPPRPKSIIDLSVNTPPQMLSDRLLAATLTKLAKRLDAGTFGSYAPVAGSYQHRTQMARWLSDQRLETSADRVLLCNGAQHALAVAFALLRRPGGTILTEAVTYPGAIMLAKHNGLEMIGIDMDEQGLKPEALEKVLRIRASSVPSPVLYITPTMQNPAATTMGLSRRREIIALCRDFDVTIIEDDVYSIFAPDEHLPLATLAPERTLYVSGLSKTLSPGLRIGVLCVPENLLEAALSHLQATSSMVSSVACMVMEEWLTNGTATSVAASIQRDAARRSELARSLLPAELLPPSSKGFHLWLPMLLSEAETVARAAAELGVTIARPTSFLVDPHASQGGIRISLGGPSLDMLENALQTIARLLQRDGRHG